MSDQDPRQSPRTRPRSGARTVAVIVIVLIVVAGVSSIGASVAWGLFGAQAGDDVIVEIAPGDDLRTVSANLAGQGLIPNALLLNLYGRLNGYDSRLQAGRYLISASMAPVDVLRTIVEGNAIFDTVTVTIPEGWTIGQIAARLETDGLFTRDEFVRAAVVGPAYRRFEFLQELPDGTTLEGYLFPDTYRVLSESTPEELVTLMLGQFGDRVMAVMPNESTGSDNLAGPLRNLHDVVTLASIVQREAGNVEEMPLIAGVFWNRLRIRMPLESDATVNYFLGTSRRQPTHADTAVANPYNTYRNYGLPPGPIGNPGLAAISATLHPASHDYLFFLHPLGGDVVMSRTYEEHLRNKARFLD